jgi:glucose/arabinose dehydrogenase
MSRLSLRLALAGALALACALPAAASAQQGPPPPTNPNGHPVTTVAQGVPTPTAFAFQNKDIFVAAYGAEDGSAPGGVYYIRNGVPHHAGGTTEAPVTGIAWRNNQLFAASGTQLLRYSGWNGSSFKKSEVLFDSHGSTAPFNGIAFDSQGRLFAGVSFTDDKYDYQNDPTPFAQSVVRFAAVNGKLSLISVATGLRQPWQLTFIGNDRNPFVTDLAQDNREPAPPDQLVHPRQGQNFGFASCTWEVASKCKGFNRPFRLLPQHSSPQGIDHIGNQLYVALFGGLGNGPEAVQISPTNPNAPIKPVLTGYVAPIVALGANKGRIYTGDLTGSIYSVQP